MSGSTSMRATDPGRPAFSLLHRDPPPSPVDFWYHRRVLFGASLFGAIVLALFAAVDGGSVLLTVDEPITRWVVDRRTETLTDFFNAASKLGDNIVVFVVAVILAAATVQRCRYLAAAFIGAAAVRPLLEFILKAGIDRERPDIEPLVDFAGPSHPSGHPLAAAALWGLVPAFVAVHWRSRFLWWTAMGVAPLVVVAVAAARVYRGAHWSSDVIASLMWAVLYLAAVQGVADRFHRERACLHPQHRTQVEGD